MASSNFLGKIRLISFFILVFAGVLIAKLFFVQVIHSTSYSERADRQYITPMGNLFERNNIYFKKRDGTLVSAATIISGFKIAINPVKIIDPEDTYQKISQIIPLEKEEFLIKVNKKDDPYEEIINKTTKEIADKIDALKIPGISVYKENWRSYPAGNMASNTIGFVAFKENDFSGRYGLERYYNDVLSRQNNNLYTNFFAEIFSKINYSVFKSGEKEGDIVTTIEPTVQNELEQVLQKGVMEKWNSDSVAGLIINPLDGSIYAMANLPNFDPNDFSQVKDAKTFANPFVENVFEFGSIIKSLTMASGLDAGVVTPETEYDDKGFVIVNKKTISNFDKKGRGVVNMQEVLNQSLNTGAVFVEQKLGKEKFNNYMMSFGVGEKTGIDLPNETKGLVDNFKKGDMEYANMSFGQGIALTPIEAARAFSVLANGGNLIKPHLVDEIKYNEGGSKKISYNDSISVIQPKTSEEISKMLVTVFDNYLGGNAKIAGYSIAAKTGTAQVSKEDGGGYYTDRHLHSFFGYFPAYDPQFLILLYTNNPKGVNFASQTLINPFIDITKFLISYYEVAPDR